MYCCIMYINISSIEAFVKKMLQDPVTGETKAEVAARLTKGHSFGVGRHIKYQYENKMGFWTTFVH